MASNHESGSRTAEDLPERVALHVQGLVQGVGFRPFVANLARGMGLVGWVLNDPSGVHIQVQGPSATLIAFQHRLQMELPGLARIDYLESRSIPLAEEATFEILGSQRAEIASALMMPDLGICEACTRELLDASDRRYGYPFINCTHCGPRFTILHRLPYDRVNTSMAGFKMCDACRLEYETDTDRRFHAQPNACPECGPQWKWVWMGGGGASSDAAREYQGGTAGVQQAFFGAMDDGLIVAVKGIGGFHLVCDGSQPEAIERLRKRKGRSNKPLAVMVPDVDTARELAEWSEASLCALVSPRRPIVIVPQKDTPWARQVGQAVAPGQDTIGILLPYSPMHVLMMQVGRPLVVTSGNVSDEPIAIDNEEAGRRLGKLVDAMILHDRPIVVPCDDSVLRFDGENGIPMRRSRGFAPSPLRMRHLPAESPGILALGGELKNTFGLLQMPYAHLSQHLGDLDRLETQDAQWRVIEQWRRIYRRPLEVVVSDLHPDYHTTRLARRMLEMEPQMRWVRVQHHHAHLASLAAEHGYSPEEALWGFCWDGTGYGTDGTIWGGELLKMRGATWERVGHLKPFPLPGGDSGVRKPYRMALAWLWSRGMEWDDRLPCVQAASEMERRVLRTQLERNVQVVATSSVGRWLDAMASLLGICQEVSFEGEGAMALETQASRYDEMGLGEGRDAVDYPRLDFREGYFDDTAWLEYVLEKMRGGWDVRRLAWCAHRVLTESFAAGVSRCCGGDEKVFVGLSGGCFQNRLLLTMARDVLSREGRGVLDHREVPANDGGLALGQLWIAALESAS